MKQVHFVTPTRLSLINLTTIGDSEKRDDPTKIGQFSSGQAYATALLLRDSVGISINIFGGSTPRSESVDEKYIENITYCTAINTCESTGKSKEVIVLDYKQEYCDNAHSFSEPSEGEDYSIETAFALQLGYNWEIWMAYRELMSNVIDEGGYVKESESDIELEEGTVITLSFNEDNDFYDIWNNRHLYYNEKEPLHKISNRVEVLENEEGWLRIYKQNILVYENKDKPSRYAFNIKFGQIDERRILSDVWSVSNTIAEEILKSKNEEFLREIITADFDLEEGEFLSSVSIYYTAPDLIHDIAAEVYQEHGQVQSYPWLLQKVKARKDCKIGGKVITTVEDSLWSYSKEVTVESRPIFDVPLTPDECFTPLQIEINKFYNFELDVEYKKAKLKGSKVVADKYEKCLIVDEKFSVENDMAELVVEYLDLTQEGNVITNLSNYILNLIKK